MNPIPIENRMSNNQIRTRLTSELELKNEHCCRSRLAIVARSVVRHKFVREKSAILAGQFF
jgi:hypothetical protein